MAARICHHDCSLSLSAAAAAIGDDGSVHSTVAVSTALAFEKVAPIAAKPSSVCRSVSVGSSSSTSSGKNCQRTGRRHAVHFYESDNEYFENHQLCRQEVQELWYTRFETRAFRKAATALAREIANAERQEEIQKSNNADSYKNILQRVFQACLEYGSAVDVIMHDQDEQHQKEEEEENNNTILTAKDYATLCRRMNEPTERWGLERMVVRKLGDDRFARRIKICKMLLELQKSIAMQRPPHAAENNHDVLDLGNSHSHSSRTWEDAKAELFRTRCQAISLPSRLFARELACACLADEEFLGR